MERKRLVFEKHGENTTKVKCIIDNTLSKVTFLEHGKDDVIFDNENTISMEDADEFLENCIWQLKDDFNTDNFNDNDICELKKHLLNEIKKYINTDDV
jgi:pantothenate kinase